MPPSSSTSRSEAVTQEDDNHDQNQDLILQDDRDSEDADQVPLDADALLLALRENAPSTSKRTTAERLWTRLGYYLGLHTQMYGTTFNALELLFASRASVGRRTENRTTTTASDPTKKKNEDILQWLLDKSPSLCLVSTRVSRPELLKLSALIDKGRNECRHSDTRILKDAVATGFEKSRRKRGGALFFNIPRKKSDRGFESDETGRLLTPWNKDWENDHHRACLKAPGPTSHKMFFHYMYENETVDMTDISVGLFRGILVVEAIRSIYFTKHFGVPKFEPSFLTENVVAYATVLLHFALAAEDRIDTGWNYEGFYEYLMKFLVGEKDFWATLKLWLQKTIFGHTTVTNAEATESDEDDDPCAVFRLQSQLKQRTGHGVQLLIENDREPSANAADEHPTQATIGASDSHESGWGRPSSSALSPLQPPTRLSPPPSHTDTSRTTLTDTTSGGPSTTPSNSSGTLHSLQSGDSTPVTPCGATPLDGTNSSSNSPGLSDLTESASVGTPPVSTHNSQNKRKAPATSAGTGPNPKKKKNSAQAPVDQLTHDGSEAREDETTSRKSARLSNSKKKTS